MTAHHRARMLRLRLGVSVALWSQFTLTIHSQTTRHVALGGGHVPPFTNWVGAATNIQDAIDAATAGDVVLVSNGVYQTGGRIVPGTVITNRVVIDKPITVQSVNGPAVTTINGRQPLGSDAVRCVWMTNGAVLAGFTLGNGATLDNFGDFTTDPNGGGVWAQSGSAIASNCVILNCSAYFRGGGAHQVTLNQCRLSGNSALTGGGGAYESTLNNCVLSGNSAPSGGGATLCTLNNCTVSGNSATILGGGTFQGTLNNCIVYFNTGPSPNYFGGTFSDTCTTPLPAGDGNLSDDPQFINAGAGNYRLNFNSPCRDTGDNANAPAGPDLDGNPRISGGTVDMGAYEYQVSSTNYVAPGGGHVPPFDTWAKAATNIQDAIDAVVSGGAVWVSNGVYQTGGRVMAEGLTNRVAIDKPISVRSVNGPEVTAIRGNRPNGDAAVRCLWMTNGAELIGFTLTNGGTRTSLDLELAGPGGGGAWAPSTDAVLSNCVLAGNSAVIGGGAANGTLNNCVLAGNTAQDSGGATALSALNSCTLTGNSAYLGGGASDSTLIDCTLTGNTAEEDGGGASGCFLTDCSLIGNVASNSGGGATGGTLIDCTLTGNTALNNGGGAFGSTLIRCMLTGNSAVNGGGARIGTLNNCVVAGNSAVNGGGSHNTALNNSTLTGNSASNNGGGSFGGTLNNCIVYYNAATTSNNYFSSTLNYSCATPLPDGPGNITNAPMFVDLGATNLALAAGSPCRDTGNNATAPAGFDVAGNPRIVNGMVDIGAHEFQGGPSPDYDADGMSNADETIAGSSAVDANDTWAVNSVPGPASVGFSTLIGRLYAVDRNDNLLAAPQVWTEFTNNIPGTGGALVIADPDAEQVTNRHYRVRVKLQP